MKAITKFKKNTNFHTTLINFIFEFKCDKSEIMALTIMSKLLSKTNKKYSSIDSFAREKLNRYIMNMNVINQSINDVYFINFSCLLPNNNIVSDYDIEYAIKFILDTIYDTNLDDVELFEKEKRLYIESLLNNYKNIEFIAEKNMLDLLDRDCKFNKLMYKDLENINNLTINDIKDFYNKYIKNVKPKIFVYGDEDKDSLDNYINSYLDKLNLEEYSILKDYNYFYSSDILIEKNDLSKYYQSIVYLVYNIKDYTEKDFYKLYMINMLLSNPSSDILFNNLRKKNNLVYSCGSSVMIRNGLLVVKGLTSKNNIKLTKLIINKSIDDLKDKNKIKDNINKIIVKIENNILREKDNFFIEPSNIINKYFKSDISTEEELEILKKMDINDLLDCINRLEIKCIYTLEGVE